jgi:predicted DNA-binding transcriptional regulator YafY
VVGHDHDRGEPRSFRADRITEVTFGEPGAFEPPADIDPGSLLRDDPWSFGAEASIDARLLVDAAAAASVIAELGEDALAERRPDGSVVVRLEVTHRGAFRSFVLGFLDHAEVLGPDELRTDMVHWLRAIAERPVTAGLMSGDAP